MTSAYTNTPTTTSANTPPPPPPQCLPGGAMVCNYCGLSLEEDCLGNSTQTMTYLTSSVYRTKGCVDNSQCDRMELLTGFNATVRLSTECCTTDQCNGATSLDVGLPAVIIAALVAVWSS
uniref:UPAR/Ly6 domain-containing protein n=1 Tax=Gadus morhua TaxID=8049 RepID=A0A8C5ARV6_GADMO